MVGEGEGCVCVCFFFVREWSWGRVWLSIWLGGEGVLCSGCGGLIVGGLVSEREARPLCGVWNFGKLVSVLLFRLDLAVLREVAAACTLIDLPFLSISCCLPLRGMTISISLCGGWFAGGSVLPSFAHWMSYKTSS